MDKVAQWMITASFPEISLIGFVATEIIHHIRSRARPGKIRNEFFLLESGQVRQTERLTACAIIGGNNPAAGTRPGQERFHLCFRRPDRSGEDGSRRRIELKGL